MKVYEITFNNDEKVSLVKSPAIESTLLKFSAEENETLYFANEEKQVIYSVAMIPNKMIFRKNVNGEPANVFYTPETIEKFQQNYFRKNANSGTNINHSEFNSEGVYPFENWIVMDSEKDKSNILGLDAPVGSLVMGFKIDNSDVWNECKNGNLDGLSVEGRVLFKEVEPINTINMNTEKNPQNLWNMMKAFFAIDPETGEEEVVVAEEEMAEEEVVVEETPSEEVAETSDYETLKKDVEMLREELTSIRAELVKSNTELETMKAETPAAMPIVNLPKEVVKDYADMTNYEKLKFNREN